MKRKCIACRHRIPKSSPVHLTRDGVYCYPCLNRIQATKKRMEHIARLGKGFTDPEELFGPWDIGKLKEERYE